MICKMIWLDLKAIFELEYLKILVYFLILGEEYVNVAHLIMTSMFISEAD
jgi:hypothetical protein